MLEIQPDRAQTFRTEHRKAAAPEPSATAKMTNFHHTLADRLGRCGFTATVACLIAVLLCAESEASPLATKGGLVVDSTAALSAVHFATPEQKAKLAEDATQWRPIVEEMLTVDEWLRSPLRAALSPEELAAVVYRSRLADTRAGVDVLVQRDLSRLRATPGLLEERAREIWLADDGKYFTSTKAAVNLLFIDAQQRGLQQSTARYRQALRRLQKKEPFAKVASELADIVPGLKQRLPVPMMVELRSIEGAARRAIFRDLKIGEISAPIPTPEGWIIAQVLEIQKPKRQSFDDVKVSIMEDILKEASTTARLAIMAKLAEPPVVYAKEISPDPERERNAKAAATAASQLAVEMSQRKMTTADAERRLQELLELAKQPSATEPVPTGSAPAPIKP